MANSPSQGCIALTTTSTVEEAEQLARTVVEERLAACATILPGAKSIYLWQGEIESATEVCILLKTVPERLSDLENRILALHSYQTPEFLAVNVDSANASYLEWLSSSLQDH